MKKILSIIITAALLSSMSMPYALAQGAEESPTEQTIQSESAQMTAILESVKQRISVPEDYTEFQSDNYTSHGQTSYNFNWHSKDSDGYMSVQCDCDGTITNYYSSLADSGEYSPYISKMSPEEAKSNAENFFKKTNPDFPYEIKIIDNGAGALYGNNYSFDIETYVNGVLFSDGGGYISVNRKDGSITNFSINYAQAEFPSVDSALTKEDAQKYYAEKLGLEMVYQSYTDEDGNEIFYPVYIEKESDKYINALTGDIFEPDALSADFNVYSAKDEASIINGRTADAGGLTEQEISEIEKISGLISKEDIENQIKENKTLTVAPDAKTDRIRLNKTYKKEQYSYSLTMTENEDRIYVTADAKTGEILSFNRYRAKDRDEKAVYENDSALKALAGDKAEEYKFNEKSSSYERYANGIRVSGNSAHIEYIGSTLTSYYISYADTEFPSISEAMSADEAAKAMFSEYGYNLTYILSLSDDKLAAVPVYKLSSYVRINPFTGKKIDYKNEEITVDENKIAYSDLDGHWIKDVADELAYYGVGFEGGEFKPNEKITQKDFLAILSSVYDSGIIVLKNDLTQANSVYRTSVRKNIISAQERNDDAPVTREMAAIYMIRAMGAEDYAKYSDIYVPVFADVEENKGYIALLSAMGVVSGDGSGLFNPHDEITRAESASMIYKYLTR